MPDKGMLNLCKCIYLRPWDNHIPGHGYTGMHVLHEGMLAAYKFIHKFWLLHQNLKNEILSKTSLTDLLEREEKLKQLEAVSLATTEAEDQVKG